MAFDSPPILRPGDVVGGKYRVERVLGSGGMGCVVVARHVRFDDRVALKVLHDDVSDRPDLVERFLREGRAARQIRSEHVVQVTDIDVLDNGAPYMVMEYLEGSDLAGVLAQRGALSVETTVEWILQASEALADAHARGIVHRDLKPANLFLTRRSDGSSCVKVLDFGISKISDPNASNLTSTTSMVGTPIYMSPEQLRLAKDVDARADVWSIGIILFQLLTGQTPFKADTLAALALQIALDDAPPLRSLRPDMPEALEQVIAKCLAKERNERYASIGEVAMALAPFAPARARISIDRIARLSGLVSHSTAPPPSSAAPPTIETVPTMMAPSQPAPTEVVEAEISLASVASKPRPAREIPPAPVIAPPVRLASTMGGTAHSNVEPSSPARLITWLAGGVVVAVAGVFAVIALSNGSKPSPAPSAAVPTATEAPQPTVAEPTPEPAPAATSAAAPSASSSAPPQPSPTPKSAVAKKPVVVEPKPSSVVKPPQGKSNEDY